jgi:TetR/AcrR family transcriptional repressor of mexJK operon
MVEKVCISEDKPIKIVVAAQKRFAHFGLEKTAMHEIAEDVGISKAALYYYFKDKECIFKEVILKEQDDFCKQMSRIIESDEKIEVILTNYIEKRTQYLKTLLNLGKLRYDTFKANKPLLVELGRIFQEQEGKLVRTILSRALEKKEISKIDIESYSTFFISTLKAIRLYELERKELWEQGNIDKEIKRQHLFFANIFLKSIK